MCLILLSAVFFVSLRRFIYNFQLTFFYVFSVGMKTGGGGGGTAVAQWLRLCATNRKVAGSIPDGVIGIFH